MALSACAPLKTQQEQITEAMTLSSHHFRRTATIQDDSLDTTARISTQPGLIHRRGFERISWEDNFLRAIVDKKSGMTSIVLYQRIAYDASSWKFFNRINYETVNGPVRESLQIVTRDVSCSGSRYQGCHYDEHFVVPIPEQTLRDLLAQRAAASDNSPWKFKFGARSGGDFNDGMLLAEIEGFLAALDDYRRSRDLAIRGAQRVTLPNEAPPISYSLGPTQSLRAHEAVRQSGCNDNPRLALVATGPDFETFSATCTNGEELVLRCNRGGCRSTQ